jgi:hypothetical protein
MGEQPLGPNTPWSASTRVQIDRLITWGLFWTGLSLWTVSIAFILVPAEPNWRHFLVAGLFFLKGAVVLRVSMKLISYVISGSGRRRASW